MYRPKIAGFKRTAFVGKLTLTTAAFHSAIALSTKMMKHSKLVNHY